MTGWALARRSLAHYWRTNAAVALGVGTAVAVLAGALVVGDSVRASLARQALSRLGRVDQALVSSRSFREALGAEPAFTAGGRAAAPVLALDGAAARGDGTRRAGEVAVYGVDGRFWALHGVAAPEAWEGRAALLSPALAEELGTAGGEPVVLTLDAPEEIPGSTLFGRRDEPGRRLRLSSRGSRPREEMGEFALRPGPQATRAVFVPLATLQAAAGLEGRANTVLVAAAAAPAEPLESVVARSLRGEDLGLRLRVLPGRGALSLEGAAGLLDDETARRASEAARGMGLQVQPVLVYLANVLRAGERSVPYSMVAAFEAGALARLAGRPLETAGSLPPIVLNDWAAADLGVGPGARIALEYYLWEEEGRLREDSAEFELAAVVPLRGEAADRELVPPYPGITESLQLSDWDPPFPVDLSRIRPRDEEYWAEHRTTPKAFVTLETAQRLWSHRLGRLTSLRLAAPEGGDLEAIRRRYTEALAPALLAGGTPSARLQAYALEVVPVRERALAAARGTTDFGQYFVSFSFFLVVAALLLTGLFFRLGLEQRLTEVGLLRAVGFTPRRLLRLYLVEGLLLSAAGALLGAAGALLYARLVVWGLRTLWPEALGMSELQVHVSARALALGLGGGVAAAVTAIGWTLRGLRRRSPRALLAGSLDEWAPPARLRGAGAPLALGALALGLVAASLAGAVPATGAFFGAGAAVLAASLLALSRLLRRRPHGAAVSSLAALGMRGASFRPGRSLLCMALVAAASFVIVAVGVFRQDLPSDLRAPGSPTGGYTLLAASTRPLHHDPRRPEGRAALGLPEDALSGVALARFRRSAGEDASCLNLYRPTRPTVLGAEPSFLREGRFAFAASLAETDEEKANPWLLLERDAAEGVVPVVADLTTLRYVLHKGLGEEMPLPDTALRLRFVAALRPGLLQAELVTGERHFLRAFPHEEGFRSFLLDVPAGRERQVAELLESRLADLGFDVTEAAARLRAYHRVENTYIATFQALGALGLLLGTVGLAAVLLRSALERRRELALLQAVGYRGRHLRALLLSENALLLGAGLLAGILSAGLAIAPALAERSGALPLFSLAALLAALAGVGLLASWAAVAAVQRMRLLSSLRSE